MKLFRIDKGTIQESQYINHGDFAFEAFGFLFFTCRFAAAEFSQSSEVVEIHPS